MKGRLIFVLLVAAGSGFAGLICALVLTELAQPVIGASAFSRGLTAGITIFSVAVGASGFSRMPFMQGPALRNCSLLHFAAAALSLIALYGISALGVSGAVVFLLLPALVMGAAIGSLERSLAANLSGFVYSAWLGGAAVGCAIAGFQMLRVYGPTATIVVAAAVLALVAGASGAVSRGFHSTDGVSEEPERHTQTSWSTGVGLAVSGGCAMGAFVLWSRLIDVVLGSTIYSHVIVLAMFLLGLSVGAAAGAYWASRAIFASRGFAACQFLAALGIAWAGFMISNSLPYWPVDPWLSLNPSANIQFDVLRVLWTIFPPTVAWGAAIPLAAVASTKRLGGQPGIGTQAYVLSALAGTAAIVLFTTAIPSVGIQRLQQALIGASVLLGIVSMVGATGWWKVAWPAAFSTVALGLALLIAPLPWQLIAHGRRTATILRAQQINNEGSTDVSFYEEGVNSFVVVAADDNYWTLYVDGRAEASNAPNDMRLHRLLGHLPALIHPAPRGALVVGVGAGVTAGSLLAHPSMQTVVISEPEPLITRAAAEYFSAENLGLFVDNRTHIVHADPRRTVAGVEEAFDIIVSDPPHPWVRGASALFSKEFFELCKRRLNPGGVMAQWMPLYESDDESARTLLATFFDVFPYATVWSPGANSDGHDLILIGQTERPRVSVDDIQSRLDRTDHAGVLRTLTAVGVNSAVELLGGYVAEANDLSALLTLAEINTDWNLRLQYVAGLGANSMNYRSIFSTLLGRGLFPVGILVGSESRIRLVRALIEDHKKSIMTVP